MEKIEMRKSKTPQPRGEITRQKIKSAAMRLIVEKGVNVSVRDINKAAEQKNLGSINYYFNSREDLIRELVNDISIILVKSSNMRLQAAQAKGGPTNVRELVKILVQSLNLEGSATKKRDFSLRFLNTILVHERDMLFDSIREVDVGTRRSLALLRSMAPEMPPEVLKLRLRMVWVFLITATSLMEAARDQPRPSGNQWESIAAEENLIDMLTAVICGPVSEETLESLKLRSETLVKIRNFS